MPKVAVDESRRTMDTPVIDSGADAFRAAAVVLLALLPMLAACADDPSQPAPALTTDAGDSSAGSTRSGGDVDLGDFPIPAPPGGDLAASGGSGRTRLIVYPPSEYDAIVEFYKSWIADAAGSDGPPPTIVADEADRQFVASFQASDIGIVQISLGEKDGDLQLGLAVLVPS